jgi:hypothetical protein
MDERGFEREFADIDVKKEGKKATGLRHLSDFPYGYEYLLTYSLC